MRSILLIGALCLAPIAHAALIGTTVTGSLQFGASTTNFYDPANGFVPGSYLNHTGSSVIVTEPNYEFGFDDGDSRITSNFSDTQLTITILKYNAGTTVPIHFTFNDPAFLALSLVTTDFLGVTYSLSGTAASIDLASYGGAGTKTAVFDVSSLGGGGGGGTGGGGGGETGGGGSGGEVPEPSTLALLGAGIALVMLRRKLPLGATSV
jgi:uncharacterized membrane protein YgcG